MNDLGTVYGTLLRLLALLLRHESSWAVTVSGLAADLAGARDDAERRQALQNLLGIYGGMGSFNDLVLQSRQGVSSDNQQLDELRSELHSRISSLITR